MRPRQNRRTSRVVAPQISGCGTTQRRVGATSFTGSSVACRFGVPDGLRTSPWPTTERKPARARRDPARCRPPGGRATIDVRATEVEGREPPAGMGAARPSASAADDAKAAAKSEAKSSEPRSKSFGPSGPTDSIRGKAWPAAAFASLGTRRRATRLLTHLASGAVGALLVLGAAQLLLPSTLHRRARPRSTI